MATPQVPDTRLRADAARNRQAIIDAARQLYGRRGLGAPLDEIARLAGVGNATLYRHFPSRCELAAAVFADTLELVIDAAGRALADPDPWHGFAALVTFLCELQATGQGIADLLITRTGSAPGLERLRERAYRDFAAVARRAQASGTLRADFVPEDLVLLLMANAGLIARTAGTAPQAWRRFTALALDGLRSAAATPAAPPPGRGTMQRAMRARGHHLGLS